MLEGLATVTHRDGTSYKGHFKNDQYHGPGEEISPDGTRFKGTYLDGSKRQGTLYLTDGGQYYGQFTQNLISGKGTFTWSDGRIYTGTWKNNLMHG